MQNIKAIIFDLGGVLLNIDFKRVSDSFKKLGVTDFDDMYSKKKANLLFQDLEEGKLTEQDFYEGFRKAVDLQISNEQIKNAWNSILLDFRKESLSFITSIKQKYNLYLLSNTNIIHYRAFNKIYHSSFNNGTFNNYFNKAYYSHEIGLRKPDAAPYNFVLNENNLVTEETLFIDDSKPNIEAAKLLGMHTVLLTEEMRIEDLGL